MMAPTKVLDNKGEITTVYLLSNIKYDVAIRGMWAIRAGITFPCGDSFITWMPIFTEWFDEATYCYCDIGAGGKPCISRELCDERRTRGNGWSDE